MEDGGWFILGLILCVIFAGMAFASWRIHRKKDKIQRSKQGYTDYPTNT